MKTINYTDNGVNVAQSGPPLPHDKWLAEQDKAQRATNMRAGGAASGDDLEAMKVAELREQAKTAGVQGTSSMSKQELVDALSKQQQVNSGNLDVLTVSELKDRANAAGIPNASSMHKQDLIDALNKQPK